MDTVDLGPVERIPLGEGRTYRVQGELVAVFRARGGELFATQALCPHAEGPLADGLVGGGRVLCPLHAFAFDLRSGRCLNGGCGDLRTYEVGVTADGRIALGAPARDGAAAA